MFRARKFVEVPSKRSGGLLSPPHADLLAATGGTAAVTADSKRQRLQLEAAEAYFHNGNSYQQQQHSQQPHMSVDMDGMSRDGDAENVLVETPECTITMVDTLPSVLSDEIRKERAAHGVSASHAAFPQIVSCRASVPSARHSSGRQWVVYFVAMLRTKVLLWQEAQGKVLSLSLPDELDERDVLHPFLFALYGQSLSLMAIGRSGTVLFWEDIDLPYESVPLSVQIPLQYGEEVSTSADAMLSPLDELDTQLHAPVEDDLKSLVCWSNQGNVWEVAMEDRRIRVRPFEKRTGGFFSGLTKSVSQFFFASSAARANGSTGQYSSSSSGSTSGGGELDVNLPIKYIKVVPTVSDDGTGDVSSSDETADMLVLFSNGVVERRTFSTGDVMDCSCVSVRHFDATRVAISYFSDNFPDMHLAKVDVLSLPYVLDDCFALLVAFVCSSQQDATAKVKYAVFQFSLGSTSESPEPEWACVLDYEPAFTDAGDTSRYFQVECFGIARGAFYLVWTKAAPIQFASILLPRPGQTRARYAAFSLQGVHSRAAVGFGARAEANAFAGDALQGSVSFVLMDDAADSKLPGGTVCVATASNMQNVEALPAAREALATASIQKSRKRLEEASRLTGESPHFLAGNLDVQEYVRLLTTHFRDDPYSTSPLRIASADAFAVAQAAVAIDFQILDAKPSSGLRWSKEDTDDAARGQVAKKSGSVATTAHGVALVTPKLVRFQLEEKRTRRSEFLAFVQRRCANVWQAIIKSPELSRYLTEDEEKLNAAISLSKFQGSLHAAASTDVNNSVAVAAAMAGGAIERRLTGQFLLHAIERTVEQRGYEKEQLRLAGYNAFDIFYCEVSKLSELFEFLRADVQALALSLGESDPAYLHSLLEAGYSMLSMLKPSSSGGAPTSVLSASSAGSWAFTRTVRDVLVDHIARLTALVGYASALPGDKRIRWSSDETFEVTDQIQRLGGLLLDAYVRFVPSAHGEEAEDLRKESELSKRYVLNPLVHVATNAAIGSGGSAADLEHDVVVERKRSELFAQCVKLCERYAYYEGMVFLAAFEDALNLGKLDYVTGKLPKSAAMKRLEAYCKAYDGFAHFVLRWYGGEVRHPWAVSPAHEQRTRSTMLAYLLANSTLFGSSLYQYVQSHGELSRLAWTSAIAVERYDETAALALRDAERESASLAKRKNLASIAKIAALAAPDTSRNEETLQQIQRELVRTKIQELLQQLPLEHTVDVRPLTSDELVDTCLEASASVAKSDPIRTSLFLMALEAVESMDSESSEFDAALTRAWRHCLCDDDELWASLLTEYASGVSEHKLEQLMRQTLLFAVMQQYLSHRATAVASGTSASAALSLDLLDDLLEHEGHEDHAVLNVRSRQVLAKTLNFALTR